jgi:hypothetical protein
VAVDRTRLAHRLRRQGQSCAGAGSPLYGELLSRAADDVLAGGPCLRALTPHADLAAGSALALRLILRGRAPALAACYPSVGGTPGPGTWAAFREAVDTHREVLVDEIARPVQTNEVGRAAALLCGLLATGSSAPLRLLELGASAGLNLLLDRYRYPAGGTALGDPASPVTLDVFDPAAPPPAERRLVVASRRGCDRAPLDPRRAEDRETLVSFVWADQTARVARLQAALALAAGDPAPVDRADAGAWLAERLAEGFPGPTVVMHSLVMQYLTPAARAAVGAALAAAGDRATRRAPLFRVAMEPAGPLAEVRLTRWPGGSTRIVARAGYHGAPVTFLG